MADDAIHIQLRVDCTAFLKGMRRAVECIQAFPIPPAPQRHKNEQKMRKKMVGTYCDNCRKPIGSLFARTRRDARFCSSHCEYEHKQMRGGRLTKFAKWHH